MRIALSLMFAIPVAAAGAMTLIALPTGSPASDVFDLGSQRYEPTFSADAAAPRSFSPQLGLLGSAAAQLTPPAPVAAVRPAPHISATAGSSAGKGTAAGMIVLAQAGTAASVTGPVTPSTSAAVVTGSVNGRQVVAQTPAASGAATRQPSRTELAQALQRELKRVGCYSGDANGEWTPATRQAMNAFLQRLNASLPTAEPDFILLTLVQGQTTIACTGSCPIGQSMADSGHCVPAPTLAQRNSQPVAIDRTAPPQTPMASAAGKAPEGNAQSTPQWRTAVTPAKAPPRGVETRPADVAVAPPVPTPAAPATVISGRMAIGAPVAPADTPSGAQQASPSVAPFASGDGGVGAKIKTQPSTTARRPDGREPQRSAEAPRPRRDANWTKNFFDR